MKKKSLVRTLCSVSGVMILVKLLGFVKQMAVAAAFGATLQTDLISIAQGFIGNIQYVVVEVLLTSLVSVYIYAKGKEDAVGGAFATDTLKAFSFIAVLLTAVIALGAPWIARVLAPGYSAELSGQLSSYLRILVWLLPLFVWIAVCQALLNANLRFFPGQMLGLYQSVILLLSVWLLAPRLGVNTLVISFFGYILFSTVTLGWQARTYFAKSRGNPFRNPYVREMLTMMMPLLVGYSAIYVNQQVDKMLVSGLPGGSVTALGYGATLSNLVGALIISLCAVLSSHMTTYIAEQHPEKAARLTEMAALGLTMLLLPVTVISVCCARDIVTLAFGRGAFGAQGVATAALALAGYGFSFIPMVWQELYSRIQYSCKNSKTPMVNSTISIVFNIILSILLCPRYGVLGVAFATSAANLLCAILHMATAKRAVPNLTFRPFLIAIPWLTLGGVAAVALVGWCGTLFAAQPVFLRLCGTTICVFVGYAVAVSPLLIQLKKRTSLPS